VSSHERASKRNERELEHVTKRRDELAQQLEIAQHGGAEKRAEFEQMKRQADDATNQLEEVSAKLAAAKEANDKLLTSVDHNAAQMLHWRGEAQRLQSSLARCQQQLSDAQAAVVTKQHEMNEITDQAATRADLQSAAEGALAQAQRDLDSLSRELHQVHNQMGKQLEEVTERMGRQKEASRVERAAMAKATLQSLQQLKEHLTATLTGLKAAQGGPHMLFGRNKHRWGVISHSGEFDTMVVRLEPPDQPLRVDTPNGRIASGPYSSVLSAPHLTRRHLPSRKSLAGVASNRAGMPPSPLGVGSVVAACSLASPPHAAATQAASRSGHLSPLPSAERLALRRPSSSSALPSLAAGYGPPFGIAEQYR